jgi:hypothetical protein
VKHVKIDQIYIRFKSRSKINLVYENKIQIIFYGGTKMSDKIFSIRLPEDEYHALKAMAKREVRTANSFVRSLVVKTARSQGLLDDGQEELNQGDIPQEEIPIEFYTPPSYEELSD